MGIRFGGHTIWFATSVKRPKIRAIPVSVLASRPVEEETVSLNIGPFALELPISMCQQISMERRGNSGINLHFTNTTRTVIVNLTPMRDFAMFPLTDFPEMQEQSDLRLYREIANTGSNDFSFSMTAEQLRWHKWLVANRRFIPDIESIEYVETSKLEGNLLRISSTAYNFEWGTTNVEWNGAVTFFDPTRDPGWIRLAASTFELRDDPSVLLRASDTEVKTLVASLRNVNPIEEYAKPKRASDATN